MLFFLQSGDNSVTRPSCSLIHPSLREEFSGSSVSSAGPMSTTKCFNLGRPVTMVKGVPCGF